MRMLAFALTVVLALPGPSPACELAGLRTAGVVLVNDAPMPDGGTVRPGDRIRTGPDGLAIVTSPACGRLELRAGSEARLQASGLVLEGGAVASSTLRVSAGEFFFEPAPAARPDAWFAVARRQGRILVAAHRGAVSIAAPDQSPVIVPEGSYAERQADQNPPAPAPPPARKSSSKRRRGAKAAAGSAASGGWTIGGLSHGASVALVVGLGAGAAAAAAGFALSLSSPGPSPND